MARSPAPASPLGVQLQAGPPQQEEVHDDKNAWSPFGDLFHKVDKPAMKTMKVVYGDVAHFFLSRVCCSGDAAGCDKAMMTKAVVAVVVVSSLHSLLPLPQVVGAHYDNEDVHLK